MGNKIEKYIIAIIILIAVGAIGTAVYFVINKTRVTYNNDEAYNYKIITDIKYKTLRNDGGSHTNVYYQVNLEKNKIIKYEDKYVGFKGYEYKDKIIYEKNINDNINIKLKTIIKDLMTKEDINDKNNYSPYVIELDNNKKEIYNNESIKSLENIFYIIDNQ